MKEGEIIAEKDKIMKRRGPHFKELTDVIGEEESAYEETNATTKIWPEITPVTKEEWDEVISDIKLGKASDRGVDKEIIKTLKMMYKM